MVQEQVKHWTFTYHFTNADKSKMLNPNWEEVEQKVKDLIESYGGAIYYCFGREMGASGKTPHLQGYISLNKKKSYKLVCVAMHWHVELAKGTAQQNRDYCMKEGIKFTEYGNIKLGVSGKGVDMATILQMAREDRMEEIALIAPGTYLRSFDKLQRVQQEHYQPFNIVRKCYWLFGDVGVGKTLMAQAIWLSKTYFKPANKWFNGFTGQKVLIIDDVDLTNAHKIPHMLKRIGDRYPVQGETKGGSKYLEHEYTVVTSNYTIDECYGGGPMRKAIKRRYSQLTVYGCRDVFGDTCVIEVLLQPREPIIWRQKWTCAWKLRKI